MRTFSGVYVKSDASSGQRCAVSPLDKDDYNSAHRHPYSAFRQDSKAVADTFGGSGYSIITIDTPRCESSRKAVDWMVYRFEISKDAWRNEFDHILGIWLKCWRAGLGQAETNKDMRITAAEGKFLAQHVRKYFKGGLGPPPRSGAWGSRLPRKMKGGVASAVIRRFQKGYKQAQAVSFQYISPV